MSKNRDLFFLLGFWGRGGRSGCKNHFFTFPFKIYMEMCENQKINQIKYLELFSLISSK